MVVMYRFPSRHVYGAVCTAVLLKYPFLADFDGSSVSIWLSYLNCCISHLVFTGKKHHFDQMNELLDSVVVIIL